MFNKQVQDEYKQLLVAASELPPGAYYAKAALIRPVYCCVKHGTLSIRGPYTYAVAALKRAKRMAVVKDIASSGSDCGVQYWVSENKY